MKRPPLYKSIINVLLLIINGRVGESQIITQSVSRLAAYPTSYGQHDGIGNSLLSFMQLVRQRSSGNQLQQCPCVHLPGSDKCISYDSRYLAVSVEEAILTFVDQTMDPRFYTGPITPGSFTCSSFECRQCVAMISARLRQIGLLRRQLTFSFPIPTPDQINPNACPRIRLSRGINVPPPSATVSWATEAINAAALIREEFSRRPRSIFALMVEQAVKEARAAAGRPQISNILQSAGSHLVSLAATAANQGQNGRQNGNGQNGNAGGPSRNQNNNGQGQSGSNGNIGRSSGNQNNNGQGQTGSNGNIGGSSGNQNNNGQSNNGNIGVGTPRNQNNNGQGQSGSNNGNIGGGRPSNQNGQSNNGGQGGINVGGNVGGNIGRGISGGGRFNGQGRNGQNFQSGLGSNGRIIGESRPRVFPNRQPPRFQPNIQQQFTQNPGQIGRFQQAIGNQFGNQGQPQIINQPQTPITQPQQQFQQNWNGQQQPWNFNNGGQQWTGQQQPGWNGQQWTGQQPGWNGGQQAGFGGIQPQAVTNVLGQASQFIPNPFGGSSGGAQFGGGNANGGGNNGIGLGVGAGGAPNWGGIGGGGAGAGGGGSSEHGGGIGIGIGGFKRTKRQSAANVIGERFIINCIEKGDAETESPDFLNLCTVCWTWRQLPENYFPRLLNELVCQEDDYCLSGWGTCKQKHRNVDILQKNGNDWIPTTISTAACCDCKVRAGSDAHSLVIGGKK